MPWTGTGILRLFLFFLDVSFASFVGCPIFFGGGWWREWVRVWRQVGAHGSRELVGGETEDHQGSSGTSPWRRGRKGKQHPGSCQACPSRQKEEIRLRTVAAVMSCASSRACPPAAGHHCNPTGWERPGSGDGNEWGWERLKMSPQASAASKCRCSAWRAAAAKQSPGRRAASGAERIWISAVGLDFASVRSSVWKFSSQSISTTATRGYKIDKP
eukprot:scaffold1421_cov255-Pinguiococcus_pyrenoidosus.AAC.15